MKQAQYYASLSVCNKRQVGCVVVKNNEVIAYGFNHGYTEECTCSMAHKNPNVVHAEQMALSGVDDIYRNADLYVTYQPCMQCAELIVAKGIQSVYYIHKAKCSQSLEYLSKQNVLTYVIS